MCHNRFLNKYVLVAIVVVLGVVVMVRPSLSESVLLLALIAACPLAMMFMMRGMDRNPADAATSQGPQEPSRSADSQLGKRLSPETLHPPRDVAPPGPASLWPRDRRDSEDQ